MKEILLINQAFYPDVAATGQQLTDLAKLLASRGHSVTVLTGARGYEDPLRKYAPQEVYHGIKIRRLRYSAFGRSSRLGRIVDFLTFHLNLIWKLLWMPRQDVVVALTSPPLVSLAGAFFCLLKGGSFVYWVMDMNPDEAVAAGWLREKSLLTRFLRAVNGWTFRYSRRIVALDRFMKDRIIREYGITASKIEVLPPWSHDDHLRPVAANENQFRKERGLDGKFVVMYSGNHSPCHPLDTLLEAALALKDDSQIVFYFIGGGSLVKDVRMFKEKHNLHNIVQLGYQPMEKLSESLSAADLHAVVMGEAFVGIVHPCKLYGILAVGRPFVFIGPPESHVGDFVQSTKLGEHVRTGDVEDLKRAIQKIREMTPEQRLGIERRSVSAKNECFSQDLLTARLVRLLEERH